MPALEVAALAATDHTLFFATGGQVLMWNDGTKYPTVLASAIRGKPAFLVADSHELYFAHRHQFESEHWTELGSVPLPVLETQ